MKKINHFIVAGALTIGVVGGSVYAFSQEKGALKASAANVDSLFVGTTDVSAGGSFSIGGGTVTSSITNEKVILTFNNVVYEGAAAIYGTNNAPVYFKGDLPLEIVAVGTNTFNMYNSYYSTTSSASSGLIVENNYKGTTFTGTGSIFFEALDGNGTNLANSYGFNATATRTVVIDGPQITFYSGITKKYPSSLSSIGLLLKDTGSTGSTLTLKKGYLRVSSGGTDASSGTYTCSYGAYIEKNSSLIIQGGVLAGTSYRSHNEPTKNAVIKTNNTNGNCFQITSDMVNRINLEGYFRNSGVSQDEYYWAKAIDGYFKTKVDIVANKSGSVRETITKSNNAILFPSPDSVTGEYNNANFTNTIEASATGYTGYIDGNPHSITVKVTKPSMYTIEYSTDGGSSWSTTNPSFTEGTHDVKWRVTAEGIDDSKEGTATVTLNKPDPSYTAPTAKTNLVYNNTNKQLVNAGTSSEATFEYSLEKDGTYTSSIPEGKYPGTYSVYYNVVGDSSHGTLSKLGPVNVTIDKANLSNVNVSATSTTYNGSEQTPVVSESAETCDGQAVTFTYSKDENGTYGPISEIAFKNPGTYTIYYKANATYHNEASGSFTFEIQPKVLPAGAGVTVTSPTSFDYTGQDAPITIETNPLETTTGDEVTYLFSTSEAGTYVPFEDLHLVNAGEYTIYWKAVADGYIGNTDSQGTFNITINKVAGTITTEPAAKVLSYTGQALELISAGESSDGTFKYRIGDEGEYGTALPKQTNVGEYHIWWYFEPDGNHSYDMEPQMITVKISENDKALLASTIEIGDKMLEIIGTRHEEVGNALNEALEAAKAVLENPNVTPAQIADAVNTLLGVEVNTAKELIEEIGDVTYPASGEDISDARSVYDLLPEDEQALVDNLETLEEAEKTYSELEALANKDKGLPGWGIFLIILGAILLALCGAYLLMMFVFNKWVIYKGEVRRAFRLMESGSAIRMVVFPLHMQSYLDNCIFKSKEEALKFLGK